MLQEVPLVLYTLQRCLSTHLTLVERRCEPSQRLAGHLEVTHDLVDERGHKHGTIVCITLDKPAQNIFWGIFRGNEGRARGTKGGARGTKRGTTGGARGTKPETNRGVGVLGPGTKPEMKG